MKIALAQNQAWKGDLLRNISAHVSLSRQAAAAGAVLILFPELSLTGYEPQLAGELATDPGDARFLALQKECDARAITICAGMPIRVASGIQIGMLIFQPGRTLTVYAKQHVHADEKPFFVPGNAQIILEIGGRKLAPAICYEALLPEHAAQAATLGAEIYLVSVAKNKAGIEKARHYFPQLARQYKWLVGMSNAVGPCDGFVCAGGSTYWDETGEPRQKLSSLESGLIFMEV